MRSFWIRQVTRLTRVEEYSKHAQGLNVPIDALQQAADIFDDVPEIVPDLNDPTVSLERKYSIIDHIFPEQTRIILRILCERGELNLFPEIVEQVIRNQSTEFTPLRASLLYVKAPTEEQLDRIRKFLSDKHGHREIDLQLKKDESLSNGFILRVGNEEYDWSTRGRLEQLKNKMLGANEQLEQAKDLSTQGIISILRSEIDDFALRAEKSEIGIVKWIGDGIAIVDGIDHAEYGEVVQFDCGIRGMVMDIRKSDIGVILFGPDTDIREGARVVRTGKMAGVPVGDRFCGRVVDALGAPIDDKGSIRADGYRPIESPAPSIVDRKSVSVPMETGILSIDSMFPIGRGQRELIIGDRQTGKTSIAMDTIINQRGKDTICIYVAIGQKASTIAKLVGTLEREKALDYTIVVAAMASDPAPLQYIAPYSGTALAEYFMYQGKDVLIIYDDLSKHAVAYRAISLLLERPPGREAFPGDVFYLHSRLLERSSRLTPEAGGGSLTALPIIETQAGDVSAYIPTNVISITDGQIFLESNLFFAGQRPAVNVGLSVSRVGGAAQTKAMKKASGSIRIDLAQYREMEVFTQFSSDLDEETKAQLSYGASLMELLKQPVAHPMSMEMQVLTLVAAGAKVFTGIPVSEVKPFQARLLKHFEMEHADLIGQIRMLRDLPGELRDEIVQVAKDFAESERR
ncbi:MAG: F0F1 ATP synthase subunit alpha [Lachnospiraceae bacterium]|nr:F0F1 ATP synthase subunit alpha [Lachnospiraceae bacterium]